MPGLGRPSPSLYVRPPGGPGRQVFFKLSPSACWSCCPSANIMQSAVTISNRGKEESWHKGLRLMGGGRRAQRRLVTAFAGYQCSKACGSTSLLQPISCKKKEKKKKKENCLDHNARSVDLIACPCIRAPVSVSQKQAKFDVENTVINRQIFNCLVISRLGAPRDFTPVRELLEAFRDAVKDLARYTS